MHVCACMYDPHALRPLVIKRIRADIRSISGPTMIVTVSKHNIPTELSLIRVH